MPKNKKKFISIKFKIFAFVILVLTLFPALLMGVGYYFSNLAYDQKIFDKANESNNITNTIVEGDSKMLASIAEVLAKDHQVSDAYLQGDRDKLYTLTSPLFEKVKEDSGVTHLYFIDKSGKVFLRTHDSDNFGDTISRATFKEASTLNRRIHGIELGKTGFALRSVGPWVVDGELIGYIEVGEEIDHFLSVLKENVPGHYEAFGLKQYLNEKDWSVLKSNLKIDETWNTFADFATVAESIENTPVDSCVTTDMKLSESLQINFYRFSEGNVDYACNSLPITTLGDKNIGSIYFAIDVTEVTASTKNVYRLLGLSSALLFFILLLISYLYIRRVLVSPIELLTSEVTEITKTANFGKNVTISTADELSQLGDSFNDLKNKLHTLQSELEIKVEERTSDLEKLNESLVGRELKMIELKQVIAKLKDENK